MRRVVFALGLVSAVPVVAGQLDGAPTVEALLERAGEQVARYFARAQSLVCLEIVHLQPLTASWSSDGFGRTVESELRLSWEPAADGSSPVEARTLRQVLRVNGGKPRANDRNDCTTPEQEDQEEPALSLLLPRERPHYRFAMAGRATIDGRAAVLVDYELLKKVSVESALVEGRDTCVSFHVEGGMRGRIWIDAESHEVRRLDQRLSRMVTIPVPKRAVRSFGGPPSWTMERWDTSIRFKQVSFGNPDEALVLPTSSSSLQVTIGSGTPRLRTMTKYTNYRRFLTGGRVVGE